ncbi:hypothetical protein DN745_05645 [Bradymonas sediminis]|uniref:Uncharacterized protein n=1 Tax=Bradymonas sediminis TaxID=1548548 RepID=A0A2Z4FJI5_9DELT|nr:hypothetical protein DN745_05645 [Bradymonas sediminis]
MISGELGFLSPMAHSVQFSKAGTDFDYVDEGGQDNLYQFMRLQAEFDFKGRHKFIFLYQPLEINTEVVLRRDVRVDDVTFPEGTPMELRYGFPFYRVGYLYDFLEGSERELAIGAALQLRNATIDFKSADGQLFRSNRNVGPVPLLKLRARLPLAEKFWWSFDATGFYAPIKYINGGDSDVTGAILDASLRVGRPLTEEISGFVNLRYLAGGGEGTSKDDDDFGDGYVSNWLHFATVSLGFTYGAEILD